MEYTNGQAAAAMREDLLVRATGITVNPGTNLVSQLLYVRDCLYCTTVGPKILRVCEGGAIKIFWKMIELYDYIMFYADFILMGIMCGIKLKPPQVHGVLHGDIQWTHTEVMWAVLFLPVLLHVLVMIFVMMTLGLRVCSALRFALFLRDDAMMKDYGSTNEFIEISRERRMAFAYSDDQRFMLGLLQQQAKIKFMIYGASWKRLHLDLFGYFNCFGHWMMACVIVVAALCRHELMPSYLLTYAVWYVIHWAHACNCINDTDGGLNACFGCAAGIVECVLNIIVQPLACCCRCCCVASYETVKNKLSHYDQVDDAVRFRHYSALPGLSNL